MGRVGALEGFENVGFKLHYLGKRSLAWCGDLGSSGSIIHFYVVPGPYFGKQPMLYRLFWLVFEFLLSSMNASYLEKNLSLWREKRWFSVTLSQAQVMPKINLTQSFIKFYRFTEVIAAFLGSSLWNTKSQTSPQNGLLESLKEAGKSCCFKKWITSPEERLKNSGKGRSLFNHWIRFQFRAGAEQDLSSFWSCFWNVLAVLIFQPMQDGSFARVSSSRPKIRSRNALGTWQCLGKRGLRSTFFNSWGSVLCLHCVLRFRDSFCVVFPANRQRYRCSLVSRSEFWQCPSLEFEGSICSR